MFAHFTGEMRQNLMLIVQFDPKHCARQHGRYCTFQLNRFFTAHAVGREPKRSIIATGGLNMRPWSVRGFRRRTAASVRIGGVQSVNVSQTNHVFTATGPGKVPRRVYHAWRIGNRPSVSKLSRFNAKARIFWSSPRPRSPTLIPLWPSQIQNRVISLSSDTTAGRFSSLPESSWASCLPSCGSASRSAARKEFAS